LDSEGLSIDWSTRYDLDEIGAYVEKWRILVWDKAFYFILKKSNSYFRFIPFKDQEETINAVKWLVYRFDTFIHLFATSYIRVYDDDSCIN